MVCGFFVGICFYQSDVSVYIFFIVKKIAFIPELISGFLAVGKYASGTFQLLFYFFTASSP